MNHRINVVVCGRHSLFEVIIHRIHNVHMQYCESVGLNVDLYVHASNDASMLRKVHIASEFLLLARVVIPLGMCQYASVLSEFMNNYEKSCFGNIRGEFIDELSPEFAQEVEEVFIADPEKTKHLKVSNLRTATDDDVEAVVQGVLETYISILSKYTRYA